MKSIFKSGTSLFSKVLIVAIFAVVVVVIFGTAIAFVSKKASPGDEYRKSDPTPQKVINMSQKKSDKVAAYTLLGEIRAVTKAPDSSSAGTVLVVTPWFSYPDGDTVLFEELSDKTRKFKTIIAQYFSEHTVNELHSIGEKKVKEDLLHLVNAELVLGKITAVYFDDYVFFE